MKSRGTLFENDLEDVFLKSVNKEKVPKTGPASLATQFYICSSASKKTYFKYYFELRDHFIFCRKERKLKDIAFMDVKHAFMKFTKNTNINGKPHYGIKFIKKKTYEELYHQDETVITQWFEELKKHCILTKFR